MKSLSDAEAGHVYIGHLLCCMHHSKCYTSSEIVQGMSTDYGFLLLFTRCTARVQCRQGVISPLFEGCSINQIKWPKINTFILSVVLQKSVSCSLNIGVARVKSALGKQIYAQHHWRAVQSKKNVKNITHRKWQETDRNLNLPQFSSSAWFPQSSTPLQWSSWGRQVLRFPQGK